MNDRPQTELARRPTFLEELATSETGKEIGLLLPAIVAAVLTGAILGMLDYKIAAVIATPSVFLVLAAVLFFGGSLLRRCLEGEGASLTAKDKQQ